MIEIDPLQALEIRVRHQDFEMMLIGRLISNEGRDREAVARCVKLDRMTAQYERLGLQFHSLNAARLSAAEMHERVVVELTQQVRAPVV